MPIIWTGDDAEHACSTCQQPCDCDEVEDCRGCWYCVEEGHDRMFYDGEYDDEGE